MNVDVVQSIADQVTGDDVTLSLASPAPEALTPAQRDALPNGMDVFVVSVSSNGQVIANVDGTVTITVPFSNLPVSVWILGADGTLTEIPFTVNEQAGTVTFDAPLSATIIVGNANAFTVMGATAIYLMQRLLSAMPTYLLVQ